MSYDLEKFFMKPEFSTLLDCKNRIDAWINDDVIETTDKEEILHLLQNNNVAELRDRFYKEIEFGTGGLRGVMGNGFNRLNKYIVRRVAQGFANYIQKTQEPKGQKGVVIAYDSRINSQHFANEAAKVLCANAIPVAIFPTLETTPALSYAIRKLGFWGGLCFTASHNPPQYNGIKVYWADGAQIIPPQDSGILKEVRLVTAFSETKIISESELHSSPFFSYVSEDVLNSYYEDLKTLCVCPEMKKDLKIVFTPLHGTGKVPALRALSTLGWENVIVVPEQGEPDGLFPTVEKPNPEEPAALKLAVDLAKKEGASLVCATDPDSDRLALAVFAPDHAKKLFCHQSIGDFVLLNGNQTGALLIEHILKYKQQQNSLLPEHKVITTIVTSELHYKICKHYGVDVAHTLTGFKWIAGLVRQWEDEGSKNKYLFGTEESFGYMPGNFVRDKDAIGALCLAVEMAGAYQNKGLTLCDGLLEIFKKHGASQDALINVDLYGEDGLRKINALMRQMRSSPVTEWCGVKVCEVRDYLDPKCQEKYGIPGSDVLQFYLEDETRISMRPSGTEPKLKFYVSAFSRNNIPEEGFLEAQEKIKKITKAIWNFIG